MRGLRALKVGVDVDRGVLEKGGGRRGEEEGEGEIVEVEVEEEVEEVDCGVASDVEPV